MDKPEGCTSHDVVRHIRKTLKISRVGHLGTLDPFASGLLPVLVDGATRLSQYLMDGDKEYEFGIAFGSETDTLDPTGRVIRDAALPEGLEARLREALPAFLGSIRQVPPLYSALKMDGLSLYEHMRAKGCLPRDIETKARPVQIYAFDMLGCDGRRADFRVRCGKGTYVRSLARDLANAVGTVGHCDRLRRTGVGAWRADAAIPLDACSSAEEVRARLVGLESLEVPEHCTMVVSDALCAVLNNGGSIELDDVVVPRERALVLTAGCAFLCEVRREQGAVRLLPRRKLG